MDVKQSVFPLEDRVQHLFDVVYPKVSPEHPTGRAYKPILAESSLGSLAPDAPNARILQGNREYFKVDFRDFLDYATSELPPRSKLTDFPRL